MEKKSLYSIVFTKQKLAATGIRLFVGWFVSLDEALPSALEEISDEGYRYLLHVVTPHPGEDLSGKE